MCSSACATRWSTRSAVPPPARGCGSATTWSWSTNSRTPTPCSGRSCTGPSEKAAATLVLIGDPKQAIYAFRGADVHAYLDARQAVQSEWTLDVNWRSDEGLLAAYDALFADAQLGRGGHHLPQDHAPPTPTASPGSSVRPVVAPLRVAHRARRRRPRAAHGQQGAAPGGRAARDFVARDLAAEVVSLLVGTAGGGHAPARRERAGATPLHPGHIAVLVRTNGHALTVRNALHRGRRARRHRRFRFGVRDRAGAGLAAPARGARAADGTGPGLAGRADLLRRLDGRRGGDGRRGRVGGPPLVAAPVGGPAARPGGRLPLREGQQLPRRAGSRPRRSFG